MIISFNDTDHDSIEAVVDGIPGVEVPLTIFGEYDPGQPFKAANRNDPIGQEGLDSTFEINRVEVYVTAEWQQEISLVQVDGQLKAADFYSEIISKIEEG